MFEELHNLTNNVRIQMERIPLIGKLLTEQCINKAIEDAFIRLSYRQPTKEQYRAICEFVKGRDVFVSPPTGDGKLLCYAALPWPAKILAIAHFQSQEYEAMSPDSLWMIKRMGGWAQDD